jgi:hypothetical protein
MSKEEIEHLQWIHDRIISVYGESENVNFLIKMREIINQNKDEIEDRTADIDEDMPGEFVKIKEDE